LPKLVATFYAIGISGAYSSTFASANLLLFSGLRKGGGHFLQNSLSGFPIGIRNGVCTHGSVCHEQEED